MVAERLGMTADKAEEWIVNLIRNAKMEAKIDTAEVEVGATS
jgi:translation initiation factor 3 subunit E